MSRQASMALLGLLLPCTVAWVLLPPPNVVQKYSLQQPTFAPPQRSRHIVALDDDDEDYESEEEEAAANAFLEEFDEDTAALRYLGAERDVERYLREGRNLLGRRVAVILPASDAALEDALLLAAAKLIKLGASVNIVSDSAGAGRRPDVAKRVPYPRCTPIAANLTCAEEVARSVAGASALVLGAALPAGRLEALEAALRLLSAEQPAEDSSSNGDRDETSADNPPVEWKRGGISQLVLLSTVEVYGDEEQEEAVEDAPSSILLRLKEEQFNPQPTGTSAASLLACERALAACCNGKTAVLRSCSLAGEGGNAPLETLLSDALGLQDLLVEYLAELRAKTGLADASTAAVTAAAAATEAFTALLPPGGRLVQLTHVDELAGASVYAALSGLDGPYHVCSAPATIQSLFDRLAESKDWETFRLREAKEGEEVVGAAQAFYSTERLSNEGYTFLWPDITAPPPSDGDKNLIVEEHVWSVEEQQWKVTPAELSSRETTEEAAELDALDEEEEMGRVVPTAEDPASEKREPQADSSSSSSNEEDAPEDDGVGET